MIGSEVLTMTFAQAVRDWGVDRLRSVLACVKKYGVICSSKVWVRNGKG